MLCCEQVGDGRAPDECELCWARIMVAKCRNDLTFATRMRQRKLLLRAIDVTKVMGRAGFSQ